MPLLVDCYNVLHATMPPSLAGLDEAGLCRALARSNWAGEAIVVVCDGAPKPLGLTESPVPEVELIFSGRRRSADDVIVERIEAYSAPRRLYVASDDHEIIKAAKRRGARALSAGELIHSLVVRSDPAESEAPTKPGGAPLGPDEVDRWLARFGIDPDQA